MTLVETLVGLALLGTLLVAVLYAAGEINVQSRLAERSLEACDAADAILRERVAAGELYCPDSGEVENRPEWQWEIAASSANSAPEDWRCRIVTFTLRDTSLDDRTLVEIELLVPQESEAGETQEP